MTTCLSVSQSPWKMSALNISHRSRKKQASAISGRSGTMGRRPNFTLIYRCLIFLEKLLGISKRKEVAYSFKINKIKWDSRHFELSHLHVRHLSAGAKISFCSVRPAKWSPCWVFVFFFKSEKLASGWKSEVQLGNVSKAIMTSETRKDKRTSSTLVSALSVNTCHIPDCHIGGEVSFTFLLISSLSLFLPQSCPPPLFFAPPPNAPLITWLALISILNRL